MSAPRYPKYKNSGVPWLGQTPEHGAVSPAPPRPLEEIDAELKGVTDRILAMIGGLSK